MESVTDRELSLRRIIPAPPSATYRIWTNPGLSKPCFAPAPFSVASAELDVRSSNGSLFVMRGPEGVYARLRRSRS